MTSAERTLLRVQCASGGLFSVFLVVHLLNTAMALESPAAYDSFQVAARRNYQVPVVEWLVVLAPLAVHMGAAILRLKRSGFRRPPQPLRAQLHRYSGWFLLAVILGHVFATRGSGVFFDAAPMAGGLAFSLWWMPAMFYPYYLLLALCGLYHGLNGLLIAASVMGVSVPRALREGWGFWVPVTVGSVVLFVAILGMGGVLHDIPDPTDNDYARLYESWGVVELPQR
jgi:succinate dehydrogenase/fumarate reductase cytochrome b subunit